MVSLFYLLKSLFLLCSPPSRFRIPAVALEPRAPLLPSALSPLLLLPAPLAHASSLERQSLSTRVSTWATYAGHDLSSHRAGYITLCNSCLVPRSTPLVDFSPPPALCKMQFLFTPDPNCFNTSHTTAFLFQSLSEFQEEGAFFRSRPLCWNSERTGDTVSKDFLRATGTTEISVTKLSPASGLPSAIKCVSTSLTARFWKETSTTRFPECQILQYLYLRG